jgi:hypothetical protein
VKIAAAVPPDVTECNGYETKGSHWGDHRAGQDLTGCLKETIHGEEMLSRALCWRIRSMRDAPEAESVVI